MIKSFRHKGLASYFATGDRAGLPQPMVRRIAHHLAVLHAAPSSARSVFPATGCIR
jgi:hypothetical protein